MVGWSQYNKRSLGYESYGRMDEWLDGWRDVDLDGDRRTGGSTAGRHD